jgi:hypothetical protein
VELNDTRLPKRFWAKVVVDATGCWRWIGNIRGGYPMCSFGRACQSSHRIVYAVANNMYLPTGCSKWHIDHKCKVKLCVNPEHLELVTPSENSKRRHVGLK